MCTLKFLDANDMQISKSIIVPIRLGFDSNFYKSRSASVKGNMTRYATNDAVVVYAFICIPKEARNEIRRRYGKA